MNKSSFKQNFTQTIKFDDRQAQAEWGNRSKVLKGAKKTLRNKMRAKENQMLKNGMFNLDDL